MANIKNNSSTNSLGEILRKHNNQFKPLTKAEERELIMSHDPDTARRLLVQHNIRLVFSLARKYAPTSIDFDDLIGRGLEGLCYAAKKFDLNRNIKFITYATPWVFKYILKEYSDKDTNVSKMGVPLDKALGGTDDENGTTFANIIGSMMDPTVKTNSVGTVEDELNQKELNGLYTDVLSYVEKSPDFDEIDRTIFQRNVLEKDSIREISADLNLQYGFVNRKKKEMIEQLRGWIKGRYGENVLQDYLQ